MTRTRLTALVLLVVLVALCIWSVSLTAPPPALPANTAANNFSALRAMTHVSRIAKEPHAMGTAAHARVRAYLVEQLKLLGVQTQVQETMASQWNNPVPKAYVYNIIGVLKGSEANTGAVLLMAHYDSQPNTPGAADDGAGVAALLETARALKTEKPLKHDVILLLADGEEYGSFGATAFLKHPLAREVKAVVNVEARGNSGPSITFEMSPQNGWMVEQFAKAADYPMASSLFYEVYRLLPNYTDFSIFKANGYTGINSAFMQGFVHYHKLTDSYEHLNVNSLQQQGSNVLGLARHLGNTSLQNTKSPDKVFFNPVGTWLVHYPASLNIVWIMLAGVLLAFSIVFGMRQKLITWKYTLLGLVTYLLTIVVIAAAGWGLSWLFNQQMPYHAAFNGSYAANGFYLSYVSISIALFCLVNRVVFRYMNLYSRLTGIYLFIYLITLAQFFILPGTVYVLIFPLICCLLSTIAVFVYKTWHNMGTGHHLLSMAGVIPAICMLMPLSAFLFAAFELQLPMAAQLNLLLMAGLCLPVLEYIEKNTRWKKVPVFAAGAALVASVAAFMAVQDNKPTHQSPIASQLAYYMHADSGKAWFARNTGALDEWHAQFFKNARIEKLTSIYPATMQQLLLNDAALINDAPPVAQLIGRTDTSLQIRLSSPRQAAQFEVMLACEQPEDLLKASINGEEVLIETKNGLPKPRLIYIPIYGLPTSKAIDLTVTVAPASGLQLILCDRSVGLPAQLVRNRPDWIIPEQGNNSNMTTMARTYIFP